MYVSKLNSHRITLRKCNPFITHNCHVKWALKKRWSTLEPFWKTAPLFKSGAVFLVFSTLQSGTKTVSKWGPSCGHENGSTLEPFRLHVFLSIRINAEMTKIYTRPTGTKCFHCPASTHLFTHIEHLQNSVLRLLICFENFLLRFRCQWWF